MANARNIYSIDAAKAGLSDPQNRQFDVDFPYLQKTHIKILVNDVATTAFSFVTDVRIQLDGAPIAGDVVAISRETSPDTRLVDYQVGSVLSETILDLDSTQGFYLAQEANDIKEVVLSRNASNRYDALSSRIINVADPVAAQDAATKNWVSTTFASDITNVATVAGINAQVVIVSGISADVTTVSGIAADITTVTGITANLSTVSGLSSEVTRLGTADAVSDMNILATADIVADMNTLATADIVSDMNTLAGISANVTTVAGISADATTVAGISSDVTTVAGISANVTSVAGDLTNINNLAAALNASTTFVITIANVGGSNYFHVDGTSHPVLNLFRGNTYTFDVSDSTNTGHPLRFKNADDSSYSTGVVVVGTQGQAGATVTLTLAANAPSDLKYYCTVHGNGMGNSISVASSSLSTVSASIGNVNINAANIASINTVAGISSSIAASGANATNSANSASAAAGSASSASTSATEASNSQIAAASSAAAAAVVLDNFDDTYLGSKSSEPALDNDGDALAVGALFYDNSAAAMKIWSGSEWVAASSAGGASLNTFRYTATAGQTTFTGADDNSTTMSYTVDNLIVTANGIVLEDGTDYTASNGSSVVLSVAALVGAEINIIAFKSFTTADMVSATNGGTFQNNVTVNGTLSATAFAGVSYTDLINKPVLVTQSQLDDVEALALAGM